MARCQRQLFVGASEWRCGLKAATYSEAPGFQEAKGQTRPGQLITLESSPYKAPGRGAHWATIVAAAGASAEPWSPPEGTTKAEAKAGLAVVENTLKPGRRSTVTTKVDKRATNLPNGAERSSIFIRGQCARKSRKSGEVKGSPPKTALSVRATSSLKPTTGVGEERVRSPQTQMRNIPQSSAGLRLLDPLRSCSVAVSSNRDRKSAFPLALPLRYLCSNSVRNSSHRWTRALWSPTLPMLSSALWSLYIRNVVPYR